MKKPYCSSGIGIGDAGSQVSVDGAPIISINTLQGKSEDSIVHELFHLKLFSLGFSTAPAIRLGTEGRNFDTSPMVHAALAFVYDPLQHSLFFPEMRKMGFDPDSDQRQTVLKALREREIEGGEGLSESDKDRLRAMYYFQFSMHFTDSKLLSDLKGLYKKMDSFIGNG